MVTNPRNSTHFHCENWCCFQTFSLLSQWIMHGSSVLRLLVCMSESKLMHTKGVRPWRRYAYASTLGDSTEDVSCVRLRLVKTMLKTDQVNLIHNCKAYVKGVWNINKTHESWIASTKNFQHWHTQTFTHWLGKSVVPQHGCRGVIVLATVNYHHHRKW